MPTTEEHALQATIPSAFTVQGYLDDDAQLMTLVASCNTPECGAEFTSYNGMTAVEHVLGHIFADHLA